VPPTSGVRPYASGVWGGILDIIFGLDHGIGHSAEIKTQKKRVSTLVEVEIR
jgi:hypothetical protein